MQNYKGSGFKYLFHFHPHLVKWSDWYFSIGWFNTPSPRKLDDFSPAAKVETLRGRLPEGNSRLETEDLQAYQAVSSSLKELPQSFQDEILSVDFLFFSCWKIWKRGQGQGFHMGFFVGVKLLDSVDSFGPTIATKLLSSHTKWCWFYGNFPPNPLNSDLGIMVICPRFIKVKVPFLLLRIGLPASDSPVDSDDHQVATSQWCTSTIQKLASFTVSVLRENTQLREYTTTTGTTKAGTPRSQASADEAGGQPMKLGVVQRGQ